MLPSHGLFSAGLCAPDGAPADPLAVALMREAGIDIASHRSRPLGGWMLAEADCVYTMEAAQAAWLQRSFPRFAAKIERLGEPCGADIPDPYGQPRAAFEQSLSMIRHALQSRLLPMSMPMPTAVQRNAPPAPAPIFLQGPLPLACAHS